MPGSPSSDIDDLVHLQAQPPARVTQAVRNGAGGVLDKLRVMHGLERKALEGKRLEQLGRRAGLREHEFQLVTGSYSKLGTGLGADANPVQSTRRLDGAVRFHRDRESARMQRLDQRIVYLQQWFTAGENDKAILSRCSPF